MKTPCKDCLCVPFCRHKDYIDLISNCSILRNHLYKDQDPNNEIFYFGEEKEDYTTLLEPLYNDLKPTKWALLVDNEGEVFNIGEKYIACRRGR
jgi:hypothetical protein